MKKFIVLLLVCFTLTIYSQKDKSLLLWNKFVHANSDTQRVNTLNELFSLYDENNNDSAFKIAEQSLQLSNKINYVRGQAAANNNIGKMYYYQGNNTKALTYYLAAVNVLELQQSKSKENYKQYQKQLSSTYNNIGTIYQRQKMYDKAESYFRKSIAIDEIIDDKIGLSHCYNNIGTIKEETNKYDEAIKNYEISLKLKQDGNDTLGIPSSLINMGVIQMNRSKFKEAQTYFEQALLLTERHNNIQDKVLAIINLGDLYYMKGEYPKSITYYEESIEICKQQHYNQFLNYVYNSISMSYYRMKHFENAYGYYQLHVKMKDSLNSNENTKQLNELEAKYESDNKEKEIKLLTSQKEVHELELSRKKTVIYVVIVIVALLVVFAGFVLRAYGQKRKANLELDIKNHKIEVAYKIIEEKQKEIVDSINYAKRIQYTLLAKKEFLKENLGEHFILFKPKDIVSGDFYWATSLRPFEGLRAQGIPAENSEKNLFYLAVCDSTGHGVPGAFMSLLSIGFLSEAINEKGILKPNEVLNYVRDRLIDNVSTEGQKDGFDGILLCIDKAANTITYAAAHNNPVLIENGIMKHLPADKMPVGIGERQEDFKLYTIEASKGSILYLYTDGYPDQFGGPKGKKFKYKQLEEMLLANHTSDLEEQATHLNKRFEEWRGDLDQVDDVCVIGVRL
ncbi:MAG: tetratricopeptide repeat protein [Bacteroidetes bacterium]|nr:tetratricopeptide repeat protein [Bacteroidota bacterium]